MLPDYSVTMIQESSIVEGIVHMMAENDHNSYFQIVCFEVMALKLLFENSNHQKAYLGCISNPITTKTYLLELFRF